MAMRGCLPTLVKVHTHNYYIEGAHRHNELLWHSSVHGIAKVLTLIFLQHYYTKIAAAYKQAVGLDPPASSLVTYASWILPPDNINIAK